MQGFFDPQTGQSFLVADNLTAEAAPGTLMHEVGIHMAADGSMKALFNRAAMMLKLQKGNPFMKAVQARMDAAGETSGNEGGDAFTYFDAYASNYGLAAQIWLAIPARNCGALAGLQKQSCMDALALLALPPQAAAVECPQVWASPC